METCLIRVLDYRFRMMAIRITGVATLPSKRMHPIRITGTYLQMCTGNQPASIAFIVVDDPYVYGYRATTSDGFRAAFSASCFVHGRGTNDQRQWVS